MATQLTDTVSDPAKWENFAAQRATGDVSAYDVGALVEFALREAYQQNVADIAFFADKVKFFNAQKKDIRAQLDKVWEDRKQNGLSDQQKENLDTKISQLEERLNSVGDDAQLANVDLQNNLQRMQQTLQMMSNISKVMHDTALNTIRKIGG
jgi:hypothetical protein